MKKFYKIIISIFAVLFILMGVSFAYVKYNHHEASTVAEKIAAESGEKTADALIFNSKGVHKGSVIFYPGAFVPAASYSVWAKDLAIAGYSVYIAEFPFDFAIFAPNQADTIMSKLPKDEKIYFGGHSLGGVMMSRFAAENSQVAGIFFLGSYPDKKGYLAKKAIKGLSITASEDKVLNQEKYREARKYLPENTTFVTIKGGNHAGFGSYGKQKKDGTATITNQAQQHIISKNLLTWLNAQD